MISFVTGKLISKSPTQVVIRIGGIGLEISISLNTFRQIGEIGSEIHLLAYLHVREDLLQLFGFSSPEEKKLFLKLISISGIGPKMAQGILSGISVSDFVESVLSENILTLTRIPGIGKKTAQRLIFDLKERLASEGLSDKDSTGSTLAVDRTVDDEVLLAMVSLGYPKLAAEKAIQHVRSKNSAPLTVEELITQCLAEF
jgi:Holliday junction DNA helicase RuvA